MEEPGIRAHTGQPLARIHPRSDRPVEADAFVGDASGTRANPAWRPRVTLQELRREMARVGLKRIERGFSS